MVLLKRLSACWLALVVFSQLNSAQAAIIFRDDFEDEAIAANPPVINTTSIGGVDVTDVGTGWTSNLGGTNAGVRSSGSNQYLDLGLAVTTGDVRTTSGARLVTGTFPSTLFANGTVTIDFDLLWDFTTAGSTFAHAYLLSGGASGTPLIDLTFIRGQNAAGKRIDVLGTSGSQGVIQVNKDSLSRHITLTLNPTSFDLTVDGNTTPNLTGLSYLNAATSFDAIQFMNSANPGGRILQLDNVLITQVPAPEPSTMMLLGGGVLFCWRRLRNRSTQEHH